MQKSGIVLNSSNTGDVFLVILYVVLGLIFAYCLIILINMLRFRRRIKIKGNSLAICASEERRLLIEIDEILKTKKLSFSKEYTQLFERILRLSIVNVSFKTIKNDFELLRSFRKLVQNEFNVLASEDESIKLILKDLEDLKFEKRILKSEYNTDVAGFNFYRNLKTVSWFFKLIRINEKPML